MTSSRWEHVERLCHEALQRPTGARSAFLYEACEGDDVLRQEVESLLAHSVGLDEFLEQPAAGIAVRALAVDQDAQRSVSVEGYEIGSLLGAGAMGEVYRGRDVKLGREVAIKVLPAFVSADPERLARFAREARLLATLNHPNIGAIYGLVDRNPGPPALILELVEGETLAERIERGALRVQEALGIAAQIAEALEAAHDKGIIHRDLKPANVKITPAGVVKVLDFGLAKAGSSGSPEARSGAASLSASREGAVLGTAAYMSPEQARGQSVDKRSDIWAFGCVLYEMLTGRVPFPGRTIADTLAAIIEREPALDALGDNIPPRVQSLVRRCLQKDPRRRLHDIADARIEIEEAGLPASRDGVAATHRSATRLVASSAVILLAIAAGVGAAVYVRRGPADAPIYRTSLLPPDDVNWSSAIPAIRFALSPDGRRLAFVATGPDGRVLLWVRQLDSLMAQPLPGTEGAAMPFWSADSRFIGFNAGGKLKKIDASGGPAIAVADTTTNNNGTWNSDNVIVFLPKMPGALFRVPASGGTPSPVTTLETDSGDTVHWNPFFLPDGRHFLYFAVGSKAGGPMDARAVYVGSLDPTERSRMVLQGGSNAKYAQGYLLFLRDRSLMAEPFDARRLELGGMARPIAEGVEVGGTTGRTGAFSVAETGVLAYQAQPKSTGVRSQLMWFDRAGQLLGRLEEPTDPQEVTLSPDGTRAAVTVIDPDRRTRSIWLFDTTRGSGTRLTFGPFDAVGPIWSRDGSRVIFASGRLKSFDGLYEKKASGEGVEAKVDDYDAWNKAPMSWSPDGRFVLYTDGSGSNSLWVAPLSGDRKARPVTRWRGEVTAAQFSPNGRWIAYASNESGRSQIYVVPFSAVDGAAGESAEQLAAGKWQASTAGGSWPRWRRDGEELFYLASNNTLMAVAISAPRGTLEVGVARALFAARPRAQQQLGIFPGYDYDVSPDGQRFLVNTVVDQNAPAPITVVFNWTATLR